MSTNHPYIISFRKAVKLRIVGTDKSWNDPKNLNVFLPMGGYKSIIFVQVLEKDSAKV